MNDAHALPRRSKQSTRVAGYAGMPRSEWQDWRQVAETFVAERPCSKPAQVVEVLLLALGLASSWGDLVGAQSWVMLAPTEVYVHYVRGYGPARTYGLLDRFTRWLHGRGDITDWQRDVIRSEIDAQRGAHGCAEKGVPRVRELWLGSLTGRAIHDWERSYESIADRSLARAAIELLVENLVRQLGPTRALPLGSLDVGALIADELARPEPPRSPSPRALFASLSALFRWLGDGQHLEPSRAHDISARLAAAALG